MIGAVLVVICNYLNLLNKTLIILSQVGLRGTVPYMRRRRLDQNMMVAPWSREWQNERRNQVEILASIGVQYIVGV